MPERLRFQSYRQWAEAITPGLRAAIAGEREVPPQDPFSEAWMGYALFYYSRLLSPEVVIEAADAISQAIPNLNEIAWAFLRLKERGWLVVEGDSYALTAEARHTIEAIVPGIKVEVETQSQWISTQSPRMTHKP